MTPFVIIELDKPRQMRLSLKSIVEFEKTYGIKIVELQDNMSFDVICKLIYTMLKQEDAELTLTQTIDLLDEHLSLEQIMAKVTETMNAAFPKNAVQPGKK